jgi:hypothetical protein
VNKTSPSINLLEADYQVCLISGAQGQRVSVRLAQANNDTNSAGTIGIVTETINANQEGFITTSGQVKKINTTGSLQGETWVDGDVLYLSATTAGAITNVKPAAPAHTVIVGYVEYAHAVNGKIFVKIDNGYELDELHNVSITTPLNNQALVYETATTLWKNKTLVEDLITNGVTDKAPSQNAVFDALALKQDLVDNFTMHELPNTAYSTLTSYVVAITNTALGSTTNNSNNVTRFVPFVLDKAVVFDSFYIFQTSANAGASAYITMYIYDDSNGGLPGIKLHTDSLAAGSLSTANTVHTFNANITLQPGAYFMAFHIRSLDTAGTNPTFYFTQNTNNMSVEFATPIYGNNQYFYLRVLPTVGNLGDNPIITSASTSLPQTMFVKYKTQ